MSKKVAVCITSYRRFDLLKTTVSSFLNNAGYPIEQFIISDDSVNKEFEAQAKKEWEPHPLIKLNFNETNLGQCANIDKIYSMVNDDVDYIFHSEDDYEYFKQDFLKICVNILDEFPDCYSTNMRHIDADIFQKELFKTLSGIEFRKTIDTKGNGWSGYHFQSGLINRKQHKKVFPDGLDKINIEYSNIHYNGVKQTSSRAESHCSMEAGKYNWICAYTKEFYYKHNNKYSSYSFPEVIKIEQEIIKKFR